ncbi:N-acetylmuramoyl-L-alanine amidase family protein [Haloferula sargassicola]|uniref:N-acetylmuramoyl-L-alanine amidase n=1 Tax=Haloferula sargassicola TaxID=490096 RepID=A0ABP9UPY8_9BACT
MKKPLICLDPGHGGKDPGAVGPTGLREKDVVLSVALLTQAALITGGGVDVMLTRKDDVFIELSERAAIANRAEATLFLSIHCNSAEKPAMGIETWIAKRTAVSFPLAEELQEATTAEFPSHTDRGIKRANFAVLRLTEMAAALVELEFIHVICGEDHLRDPKVQARCAAALAAGIRDFLGMPASIERPGKEADPEEPQSCPALVMADRIRGVADQLLQIAHLADA